MALYCDFTQHCCSEERGGESAGGLMWRRGEAVDCLCVNVFSKRNLGDDDTPFQTRSYAHEILSKKSPAA